MGKRVEATITGADQFSDWYQFRPDNVGDPERAALRIGDGSAWSATIVVQTKDPDEDAADAADVESYSAEVRKTLEFYEDVDVRVGVPSGGTFGSGSIPVRISNY
ncbi:MAG: hypothetical protein KDB18_02865 [Salinibacterium sp.]|nr:hypothetical protein [Salinibacterium sp.]